MRCRGVQGVANAAYLEGFPFPALPPVAPYCAPGGIRMVSKWPFLRLARTGTRRIENTDCRIFVIYTSGHLSMSSQRFRRILKYVGPLGRAANLTLSVHDLGDKVAGVEVGHEATDLAAFYLQDAHTVVGDRVPVRSTLRCPLQRRTLLGGENVSELGPHLAEGATVAPPELAQAFVASEDTRHRDVAHLAVLGVDPGPVPRRPGPPPAFAAPRRSRPLSLGTCHRSFLTRPSKRRPLVDRGSAFTISRSRGPSS